MRTTPFTVFCLVLTACGGTMTSPDETALRTAPLWMAEVDLPGCDACATTRMTARRELWLHPLDDQLAVVTTDGVPTCVDLKASLIEDSGEGASPPSQTSAAPVDDDPIPLVRERESSPGGETQQQNGGSDGEESSEDDPIPLVRLASGKPEDDPIPLVRERDLGGARPAHLSKLPGDGN
jgi:hypothetical protein